MQSELSRNHAEETANEHEWTRFAEEVWLSRHQQVKLTFWCRTDIALSLGVFHSCPLAFIRGSNESFRLSRHEALQERVYSRRIAG
jgi:hypothetical protein